MGKICVAWSCRSWSTGVYSSKSVTLHFKRRCVHMHVFCTYHVCMREKKMKQTQSGHVTRKACRMDLPSTKNIYLCVFLNLPVFHFQATGIRFLFRFLRKKSFLIFSLLGDKRLDLGMAWRMRTMCQIVHAMNTLHLMNPQILHMDLKPGNVLLTDSLDARVSTCSLEKVSPWSKVSRHFSFRSSRWWRLESHCCWIRSRWWTTVNKIPILL